MKKLLLVTYVDFWRKGSGHRARISSMVHYLKNKIRIVVLFAGAEIENDKILLNEFDGIEFYFASKKSLLTYKEYLERFKEFIKDKYFDFALIEYIELSIVLEFLPENTITILDTHDVVFKRVQSFKELNLEYDGIILNKQEELDIYRCFDYIILIQKTELEGISEDIDPSSLLLIPHPVHLKESIIRAQVRNVGYFASQYSPNIDALKWFIENIWDGISKKYNLILNIYGNIEYAFSSKIELKNRDVVFHGFVEDLEDAYNTLDIIINPVRCGAGLKIKNVEALGRGLPLITSTHGSAGIEDGAAEAFLIANNLNEYLLAFDAIYISITNRRDLAQKAFEYARVNFSTEKCYADLLKILN